MILKATLTKLEQEYKALERANARRYFQNFVTYTYEGYSMQWFHRLICAYLQALAEGPYKKANGIRASAAW